MILNNLGFDFFIYVFENELGNIGIVVLCNVGMGE